MFTKLDNILSGFYADDYWADVALAESSQLLATFDEVSWQELCAEWQSKSQEWQQRLAEILRMSTMPEAVSLLQDVMRSGSDTIFLQGIDSILSMAEVKYPVAEDLIIRARLLANTQHSKISQYLLLRFLKNNNSSD